ncbi:hypothetical protein AAVH_13192 [Aphelenchoides avenae]|nr:hypothetical protein AAVH_13192 [Aphelenchus avenae]
MGAEISKDTTYPVDVHLDVDDGLTGSVRKWAKELGKYAEALKHVEEAMKEAANVGRAFPERFNLTIAPVVRDDTVQFMAVAYVEMIAMIVAVVVIFAFSSAFKKFIDYQARREELRALRAITRERRQLLEEKAARRREEEAQALAGKKVDKRRPSFYDVPL